MLAGAAPGAALARQRPRGGAGARQHACIRRCLSGAAARYRWSSRAAVERLCSVRSQAAVTQSESSSGSRDEDQGELAELISRASVEEVDTPEGLADVQSASQPSVDLLSSPTALEQEAAAAAAERAARLPQPQPQPQPELNGGANDDLLSLCYAVSTGAIVATSVFLFDVSIQYIHDLPDIFSANLHLGGGRATGLELFGYAVPFRCVMPIGAGLLVAWLQSWGFSPALKFLTRAIEGVVDDDRNAGWPKSYGQVRAGRGPPTAAPACRRRRPPQAPGGAPGAAAQQCPAGAGPDAAGPRPTRRCCARRPPRPSRSARAPRWGPRRPLWSWAPTWRRSWRPSTSTSGASACWWRRARRRACRLPLMRPSLARSSR
jgi:hypothetical protein